MPRILPRLKHLGGIRNGVPLAKPKKRAIQNDDHSTSRYPSLIGRKTSVLLEEHSIIGRRNNAFKHHKGDPKILNQKVATEDAKKTVLSTDELQWNSSPWRKSAILFRYKSLNRIQSEC